MKLPRVWGLGESIEEKKLIILSLPGHDLKEVRKWIDNNMDSSDHILLTTGDVRKVEL